MVHGLVRSLKRWRAFHRLSPAAKLLARRDRSGPPLEDPGIPRTVGAAIEWLAAAQDRSASGDGGFARHYHVDKGWATSYPETTGYIIPTLLECAQRQSRPDLTGRARRALDWLLAIQMPSGGFPGGLIDSVPQVHVTFNTGQILLGLAAGARAFGEPYLGAAHRAARFLRDSQDPDGCWRRNPTPFAAPGEKAYETHVAWGLLEADRVAPGEGYGETGLRNIRWAIGRQQPNGWVRDCDLEDPHMPLTHTIGYWLRGVLEGYLYARDPAMLEAAERSARALLAPLDREGRLPGRIGPGLAGGVPWVCLTGTAQIAWCWLKLGALRGEAAYLDAGRRANRFVRRTILLDAPAGQRGGVKGSHPLDGDYGRLQYLNWACKFFVDAQLLEADLSTGSPRP